MNAQPTNAEQTIETERLIALELRRAIAREADLLTERADDLLKEIGDMRLTDTQINGLLGVVDTADKIADVVRFLERQGGRRQAWQLYAEHLIREVRGHLKSLAEEVAGKVQRQVSDFHGRKGTIVNAIADPRGELPQIHLLLAREFLQSFGVGYIYRFKRRGERETTEEA
jgi:hypothetical protein